MLLHGADSSEKKNDSVVSFENLSIPLRIINIQNQSTDSTGGGDCLYVYAGKMVSNGDLRLFHLTLPVILPNTADPDQTPRFSASDLGLHCFSMSQH